MSKSSQKKWTAATSYYMYNDEVLDYLDKYHKASGITKERIQDDLVGKLTYLVQARVKGYKGKPYYIDLLQEGRVGLLKAIEKFDINRGANFFKYAVWQIQSHINLFMKWKKRCNKRVREEELGFSTINIKQEDVDPEIRYELGECKKILMEAIESLPEIDKQVVVMRYGIGTQKHTLDQLGNMFSLSRQRIQQIEHRAISRLQNNNKFQEILQNEVL